MESAGLLGRPGWARLARAWAYGYEMRKTMWRWLVHLDKLEAEGYSF
jgi:hypothetical protein